MRDQRAPLTMKQGVKKYVAKGYIVLMRDTWGTGTDSVGGNYRKE